MHPRLVFMGTPDFAVPALTYLVQKGFPVLAVVTQPDRPRGRGYRTVFSAVKQAALELGLKILQPADVNTPEFLDVIRQLKPEAAAVAAFGQILKTGFLELPALGCLNLHASLLPKYRGAAPIQWAIARGEIETGLTVQKMALRLDSGPVLLQKRAAIGPDETATEVHDRLSAEGGPIMAEALDLLAAGAQPVPQDESAVTLAPRLTREDGRIDWTMQAGDIHNRVRAFNPWPGTYTIIRGDRLKIISTRLSEISAPAGVVPGTVLQSDSEWLVAAGCGTTLKVLRVQCENSTAMSAQAFTCGYSLGTAEVLGIGAAMERRKNG